MQSRLLTVFVRSTAILLLLTAGAKLYSAGGSARILTATDPLFHLTNRELMLAAGLLEAAIAVYLLAGRSRVAQTFLIFWLSANFILYRFGLHFIHHKVCPCLGTLTAKLPLKPETVDEMLRLLILYWFVGSAWFWFAFLRRGDGALASVKPLSAPPARISA